MNHAGSALPPDVRRWLLRRKGILVFGYALEVAFGIW
jgi:hypothetical protein